MNEQFTLTIAFPNIVTPQKAETFLKTLDSKLFVPSKISAGEANRYYVKFYDLISKNKLSIETISLFEQRVLANLIFPTFERDVDYLLSLNSCWLQIQKLLLRRLDSQTVETLCLSIHNCNVSLVPNFDKIVGNLDYIISSSTQLRLINTREKLIRNSRFQKNTINWGESIRVRSISVQLTILRSFEKLCKAEFFDEITDKDLFFSRNKFWRYYFKMGVVKNCKLLVSSELKEKAGAYTGKIINLTENEEKVLGLMFHVGNIIFIEWAVPKGFNSILESEEGAPKFEIGSIKIKKLLSLERTKHRANNYSFWQYRTASLLKTSTGIQPSKADYL